VAADEVKLQFAQLRSFDVNVGEFAKAGVYTIDGAAFSDDLFHHFARLLYANPCSCGQGYLFLTTRDSSNLCERESLAIKFEHGDKAKEKSKKEK
jgi:hypothetical protein